MNMLPLIRNNFKNDKIIYSAHARQEMLHKEEEMKCVICKSGDIAEQKTEEEIRVGSDIVFVSVKALVCNECGEKYYSRAEMKRLEDMERLLRRKQISLEKIGEVLKPVGV